MLLTGKAYVMAKISHYKLKIRSNSAAKCYEDGLGCRRDYSKAVQFYKYSIPTPLSAPLSKLTL